jgi:hypothetical protein
MTSPHRRFDARHLADPGESVIEISDAEQEVVDGGNGGRQPVGGP